MLTAILRILYVLSHLLSRQHYGLDPNNYDLIFRMRKLGCKRVKELAQVHKTTES